MKNLIALIISGALVVSGYSQTRSVLVGTNNAVVQPTNFWSADASNARTGLGLGTAATNPASAFQSSSTVLSNLASSNGANLTNIALSGVVGALATNGSASGLTNFPASLLTTNGSGAGLTNLTAANITGTIAISNGGSGSTTAGGARTNLELGETNNVIFATLRSTQVASSGIFNLTFGQTNTGFRGIGAGTNDFGYYRDGSLIWDARNTNLTIASGIAFSTTAAAATTRTNLGLGWSALTNSNAATSLLGVATNGNVVYSGTNQLRFSNAVGLHTANYSNSVTGTTVDLALALWDAPNDEWALGGNDNEFQFNGDTRRDNFRIALGLGWSALTNSNAGTGLVSVNTNGVVVSPTNFWQVAPLLTVVQYSQPVVNSTNAASNSRNLYLYSLAISTTGITNTITLPTNTATLFGDVATIIHEGPTNSVTAIRQIGSATNIITINQFQEAVQFLYNGDGWKLADNISYIEPIYFSGTNAALHAAASRTNLGLGATWLTNTNVTNFRTAVGLGATNNVAFNSLQLGGGTNTALFISDEQTILGDGVLYFEAGQIIFKTPIEFNNTTNAATTRTNLGLGLPALTNTSVTNFQAAIFNTNSAPTNSANVNAINFNTAIHWMEVNVVTNGVTNNFRIPLFK